MLIYAALRCWCSIVQDFVWYQKKCTLTCDERVVRASKRDYDEQTLNFYKLWEISDTNMDMRDSHDTGFRDSCPWNPVIENGMLGLFQQKSDAKPGLFLVCISSVPSLGSELMKAIKSDVQNRCSLSDFANSKEVWFLESISRRNRLRMIYKAATELGLRVCTTKDCMAHASQREERIAVESCGALHESLYSYESPSGPRVVHSKGCVDPSLCAGPIPLWMGNGHPIITFLPESIDRTGDYIENDLASFSTSSCRQSVTPFPTVNIFEHSADTAALVKNEKDKCQFIHTDDILSNIALSNIYVPPRIINTLNMRDAYNDTMFYAVQYSPELPLVIYPKTNAKFLACQNETIGIVQKNFESTAPAASTVKSKPKPKKYSAGLLPTRDVLNSLFRYNERCNCAKKFYTKARVKTMQG